MLIDDIEYFYKIKQPYKFHVVEIIKNEKPEPIVIYKYYGKHKQWWHYEVETIRNLIECFRIGLYTQERKSK